MFSGSTEWGHKVRAAAAVDTAMNKLMCCAVPVAVFLVGVAFKVDVLRLDTLLNMAGKSAAPYLGFTSSFLR